jgi:hypothetical protein
MSTDTLAKHTFAAIAFTCALLTLSGCGGAESEAVAQEPQVDPRFATADALLAHYNSIATRDPVNPDAMMELMYAETPAQQQFINLASLMMPLAKLDHAMFEQFGECLEPKDKRHQLSPDEPARMSKREDSRCQAEFTDHAGDKITLYLVRVGDRWWVSGYTFEYDPDIQRTMKESTDLSKYEQELQTIGTVAQSLIARIRASEFKTADEARKAYIDSIVSHTLQRMKR